ncbi:hypothetical protein [Sphingosinithalassobacter sp. CS137]|uniref:hypothetical protein n=1 Tax=Sphingosinithalassobacter sp. CS137 TaxID=2762748 RepID=UPI00165D5232|nr:hypothetical protein [Sphingosinithalassobacter sp. CS137]
MTDQSHDFPATSRRVRRDGWTAERQRLFLETLAETGCVSDAAAAVGLTPRSAYRLRARADADAFHRAWDAALVIASQRLTTIAFERAVNGTLRQVWHRGECVGEERVPSDRLLIFLLKHFDAMRYGNLSGLIEVDIPDPRAAARAALPALTQALTDSDSPAERLRREDFVEGVQPAFDMVGEPVDVPGVFDVEAYDVE